VIQVTVEGQYFYSVGNTKQVKPYTEKFVLKKHDGLHNVIRKRLLKKRLQERYEDFRGIRVCDVVDVQVDGVPKATTMPDSINNMNRNELVDLCLEHNYPIDPMDSGSVLSSRPLVMKAYVNRLHGLEGLDDIEKAKKIKQQKIEAAENIELERLNRIESQAAAASVEEDPIQETTYERVGSKGQVSSQTITTPAKRKKATKKSKKKVKVHSKSQVKRVKAVGAEPVEVPAPEFQDNV